MKTGLAKLLIGVRVKLLKTIQWHELTIPRGTRGYIVSVIKNAVAVDFGSRYGRFEVFAREITRD